MFLFPRPKIVILYFFILRKVRPHKFLLIPPRFPFIFLPNYSYVILFRDNDFLFYFIFYPLQI